MLSVTKSILPWIYFNGKISMSAVQRTRVACVNLLNDATLSTNYIRSCIRARYIRIVYLIDLLVAIERLKQTRNIVSSIRLIMIQLKKTQIANNNVRVINIHIYLIIFMYINYSASNKSMCYKI